MEVPGVLVLLDDGGDVLHDAGLGHPADAHVLLHVHRVHAQVHQQHVKVTLLQGTSTAWMSTFV